MLEFEPIGQRGRTATGSGRNGNKESPAPLQKHSPGDCTVYMGRQAAVGGSMDCMAYRFAGDSAICVARIPGDSGQTTVVTSQ